MSAEHDNASRRVLVTGGAGFIGSHLVDALVQRGLQVTVLDDLSSGNLENLALSIDRVKFVRGSILDAETLSLAARGCSCIFHLAAAISVQQSISEPIPIHQTNALGTLMVLEAARAAGARMVLSSSAAVYGDDPSLPKVESMQVGPISPYGVQKLMGEHYVRNYFLLHGVEGFSLRYFNVYGPRQNAKSHYSGVITIFCTKALAGQPLTIYGDGLQTRDFVFVRDVVDANIAAMVAPNADGRVFNIGTGIETDLIRLSASIVSSAGTGAPVRHEPHRAGDVLRSVCDPGRAAASLGFRATVGLDAGLAATVDFYR